MLSRNHFYIEKKESFIEEVEFSIKSIQEKYSLDVIIGITFFVNVSSDTDFFVKRELIETLFNKDFLNLPISIVSQPVGDCIAIEIWTHYTCDNLMHKRACGMNYTIYNDSFGKSIWGFGISANNPKLNLRKQITFSFEMKKTVLFAEGFKMDHLVRQWNYIPNILKNTKENNLLYQNYQLFNEIRHYYYDSNKSGIYPAATGIGMDFGAMTIDFFAVKENDTTVVAELNNPNQTNAFTYGQDVLVGSVFNGNNTKKTPLFERAKYLGSSDNALVFISGTASIVGEKTLGMDNALEQTTITINNISDLTSKENLKSIGVTMHKKNYTYLRAYIKREEDMNTVMKICKEHYGDIPVLYIKADICRDELLVEIEGEAEIKF